MDQCKIISRNAAINLTKRHADILTSTTASHEEKTGFQLLTDKILENLKLVKNRL